MRQGDQGRAQAQVAWPASPVASTVAGRRSPGRRAVEARLRQYARRLLQVARQEPRTRRLIDGVLGNAASRSAASPDSNSR
ncbi:MAG: hypothetical protein ACK52I_16925 [Pseudomonadota bacterium]